MKLMLVDNFVMPAEQELHLLDLHPHLGLASLGAVLVQHGHQVGIYDPKRRVRLGGLPYDEHVYERAAGEIQQERPDAVGFTTLGCSFLFALRVAERLRHIEPELPILLGGPHATMLADEILERFRWFDVVVRYEAEETLPLVLERLRQRAFEGIPGISWRSPHGVRSTGGSPRINDLDTLPFPLYELYPVEHLELPLLRVEAGRGCPYACTFCSTAEFFQRRFRLKSPYRIVEELDRLHLRYETNEFKLDHDLFTVNRRKVLAFCEAVKDRGYRWRVSARIDRVDDELLGKMADAGCVDLYFGIETGSQRMQNIARKHLNVELVEPRLDAAERVGIASTVSFIAGYPEELQEDLDATLDMLGRTFARPADRCLPQLHVLTPEPNTPLFDNFGHNLCFDGYATPFNARLLSPADRELVREHPRLFATYHYYPGSLPRNRHTFSVDAVDLFRRVDRDVLRTLLNWFDGRLSALFHAVWSFAENDGRPGTIDPDLVIKFMTFAFGLHHPLTSLLRFSLCVAELSEQEERHLVASMAPVPAFHALTSYRLAPWVRILVEAHDLPTLLDRVRSEKSVEPLGSAEATHEPRSYLVSVLAASVNILQIDPGVALILAMFSEPRKPAQVTQKIEKVTKTKFDSDVFFAEATSLRILIPVGMVH
jgi:radical SAM superfamily enzyme YgiQ (UPF0313 family)